MPIPKLVYTETRQLAGWRKAHDYFRFYFWWWVNRIYTRVWFWLKIRGDRHIPTQGAAILAANHLSYLDANVISAASPRKVSFMIAKEYYNSVFLKWMCEFLGCIPVNRTGEDLGAVKDALRKLKSGMLLGCFPEGGISTTGEIEAAKNGIALLALRTGVPVIPIRLKGYRLQSIPRSFFTPKIASIKIGEPLTFEGVDYKDRESLTRVTQRIVDAIRALDEEG
jgi:1-acyl-sn-glycerol-3-phosphate acyltransferase